MFTQFRGKYVRYLSSLSSVGALKPALKLFYSPQNSFTYPLIIKVIKNGGETDIRLKTSMQAHWA